jgi:uncharacterized protein YcbK (DUF882 family)
MRAFIDSCRRKAVAVSFIVVGAVAVPVLATAPAHADDTYVFRGEASPGPSGRSNSRKFSQAKRMRLGATTARRHRESLTGGSPRIAEGRRGRKARAGRQDRQRTARRARGVRTASLGTDFVPAPSFDRSLTGTRVTWVARSSCLNASLRAVIAQIANTFGPVTVNSTCRSRRHNSRVGGARHSHHLSGNAVDFRVRGAGARSVYSFLRSHGSVGGLKLYRRGFFHIDIGSRRTW